MHFTERETLCLSFWMCRNSSACTMPAWNVEIKKRERTALNYKSRSVKFFFALQCNSRSVKLFFALQCNSRSVKVVENSGLLRSVISTQQRQPSLYSHNRNNIHGLLQLQSTQQPQPFFYSHNHNCIHWLTAADHAPRSTVDLGVKCGDLKHKAALIFFSFFEFAARNVGI